MMLAKKLDTQMRIAATMISRIVGAVCPVLIPRNDTQHKVPCYLPVSKPVFDPAIHTACPTFFQKGGHSATNFPSTVTTRMAREPVRHVRGGRLMENSI